MHFLQMLFQDAITHLASAELTFVYWTMPYILKRLFCQFKTRFPVLWQFRMVLMQMTAKIVDYDVLVVASNALKDSELPFMLQEKVHISVDNESFMAL